MVLKGCTLDISQIISGDNEILLILNEYVALFYNNLKISVMNINADKADGMGTPLLHKT